MNNTVKLALLIPLAASSLFLGGCVAPEYASVSYSSGYPDGYYGDNYADFYYTGRSPYSRSYGPLYYRDGGYYYMRGGSYVIYSRPTLRYADWERRHQSRDYRHVEHRDNRVYVNENRRVEHRNDRAYVNDNRRNNDARVDNRRNAVVRQENVRQGDRRVVLQPYNQKKDNDKDKRRNKKHDDN
jgi:hypothetical protein